MGNITPMWRVKSPEVYFLWSLRGADQHTVFELRQLFPAGSATSCDFGRFEVKESYPVLLLKSRNSQERGVCLVHRLTPDFLRRGHRAPLTANKKRRDFTGGGIKGTAPGSWKTRIDSLGMCSGHKLPLKLMILRNSRYQKNS